MGPKGVSERSVGGKRTVCFVVGAQRIVSLIRLSPPFRIQAFSGPPRGHSVLLVYLR
jgi:hypothetical protein